MRVTIPGKVYERFINPDRHPWSWATPEIRERKDGSRSYVYDVLPEMAERMAKALLIACDESKPPEPHKVNNRYVSTGAPCVPCRPWEARLVVGRIRRDVFEQARILRWTSKKA